MQRLGGFLITKLKQLHSRALAQCISEQGIDAFSGEQGKILSFSIKVDLNFSKYKSAIVSFEKTKTLSKSFV